MRLTTEELKSIAAAAAFIDERIAGDVVAKKYSEADNTENNELMARWKILISPDMNPVIFDRRIALTKKELSEILPLLENPAYNDKKTLPAWTLTLEEFFKLLPGSYENFIAALPAGTLFSDSDEPFQHAWAPWLKLCHNIFKTEAGTRQTLVSEKAISSWLKYMLAFLNKNFALCLISAFDLVRYNDFGFFSIPSATSLPEGSKTHYDNFSQNLLNGGWLEILKRYPVAARLISTFCRQQALYFAETLKNLEKDIEKIRRTLNRGINPGIVKDIEAGLSDFHNGGKSVIKFEFESGLIVFYKPRSGGVDFLWADLLRWVEEKMRGSKFRTPVHVEGEGCCWAENILNTPLDKAEDAASFYYKAGSILALTYILGGTDFHQENLIASGDDPILIDLETLLRPLVKQFSHAKMPPEERELFTSLEGDSVLRTCMLPLWSPISKEISRDYGALTPDDNAAYSVQEWLDINTDRMRRGRIDRKTNPSPNVAHFNGTLVSVIKHKSDIIKGFEDTYRLIMNSRDDFLSDGGPLKKFHCEIPMRYLPRQSQVYGDMISRLRSPGLMRDGAAYSIEIEGLARAFINNEDVERIEAIWRVFEAEKNSLLFLNIPLFEFTSDGHAIFDGRKMLLEDYFLFTAIKEAERRVLKLSAEDLEFQSQMIDASLLCRYPDASVSDIEVKAANTRESLDMQLLSEKNYIETASAIAEEIVKRAITRCGKPQWLTLKSDPIKHINFIGPVDTTIYEGISGIGLFLAAYEKVTGDKTHHEFALKCFSNIVELLDDNKNASQAFNNSSGYCSGIPGILWAIYNSAIYLNDERLMDAAKKGLTMLNSKPIEKDQGLDIIAGAAGSLLVLMALYDIFHDERLIALANDYAESLLDKRFQFDKWRLWPSPHAYKPLTGLAHGASGYALVLSKAYELTGNDRFREAAAEAIDYETATYIPSHNNWPDYRHNRDLKPGEVGFMGGWCSGAPGIGLARMKMPKKFHDDKLINDIENSILFVTNLNHSHVHRDHLCCGYAGRIDFLIEAAAALDRPQLLDEAKKQFSFIVNRAKKNGRYTLSVDDSKSVFTPGLFTGISGIGLTALRLINPKDIPTFLIPGL